MRFARVVGSLCGFLALAAQGCGERESIWDDRVSGGVLVQGLDGTVAVVDEAAHRVLLLRVGADQSLRSVPVAVGRRVVATAASPAGDKLYVLSSGDQPRAKASDEPPSLTIVDPGNPAVPTRVELSDPLTSIAVDPSGKRIVLHAGATPATNAGNFIQNPNELVFVDLTSTTVQASARVLPSLLGGYPKRLTFTRVDVGGEALERDLLIVESDRDLMLLDLTDPAAAEVTVPLSDSSSQSGPLVPKAIAIDPGAGEARPPTIAVRSEDDNVYLFTLVASRASPPNTFIVAPTTVTVGSTPSDFAFVHTKEGVRLAVLAPKGGAGSRQPAAMLVNPADSQLVRTDLADAYTRISVSTTTGSGLDQAVLYGASTVNAVALWDVGNAVNPGSPLLNPPRRVALEGAVSSVIDIPNTARKILETSGNVVYILDLDRGTASPLTTRTQLELRLGQAPERAWAFAPGQQNLASLQIAGPYVEPVVVGQEVADVFEIKTDVGGTALVVLQGSRVQPASGQTMPAWRSGQWESYGLGSGGITVFDAVRPDPMTARQYAGLFLEGLLP